jgi:hypothetical protein
VRGDNGAGADSDPRENRDITGNPYVILDDNGAAVKHRAGLNLVPVVVDDRHVGRDHDLVADAHVMPHVHGHPAVDGHVVADRQPGAVGDRDTHRQGVAERREPLSEYRLASNMELYLPPDIRESAEPRGSQLSGHISAAGLREKTREVVKPEVHL